MLLLLLLLDGSGATPASFRGIGVGCDVLIVAVIGMLVLRLLDRVTGIIAATYGENQ